MALFWWLYKLLFLFLLRIVGMWGEIWDFWINGDPENLYFGVFNCLKMSIAIQRLGLGKYSDVIQTFGDVESFILYFNFHTWFLIKLFIQ